MSASRTPLGASTRQKWGEFLKGREEVSTPLKSQLPTPNLGVFVSRHAGFAVQIRQLWSRNEPGTRGPNP